MSTIEPVDAEGNTTNPTKSPCDPYIFNTVLTRSKSLVVVVGSPLALLGIEEHMVKLYGPKARCWSSYLKLCLEKDTLIIPPEVEPNRAIRLGFSFLLKAKLSGKEESNPLADSIEYHKPHIDPMEGSSRPGKMLLPADHALAYASEAVTSVNLLAGFTQHSRPHVTAVQQPNVHPMQQISHPSNNASRQRTLTPAHDQQTNPGTAIRTTPVQLSLFPQASPASQHTSAWRSPAVSRASLVTQDHRQVPDSVSPKPGTAVSRNPKMQQQVLDSTPLELGLPPLLAKAIPSKQKGRVQHRRPVHPSCKCITQSIVA